jgi:hypothetical protein
MECGAPRSRSKSPTPNQLFSSMLWLVTSQLCEIIYLVFETQMSGAYAVHGRQEGGLGDGFRELGTGPTPTRLVPSGWLWPPGRTWRALARLSDRHQRSGPSIMERGMTVGAQLAASIRIPTLRNVPVCAAVRHVELVLGHESPGTSQAGPSALQSHG